MMSVFIGGLLVGCILAPLALGVFISYRLLRFPDLTVDGSFAVGAVLSARLILDGWDPASATFAGMIGGALAGLLTGLLAEVFNVRKLLAGILVMTALYSINLYILGKPSHSFNDEVTLYTWAQQASVWMFGPESFIVVSGAKIFPTKLVSLLFAGSTTILLLLSLQALFRSHLGLAIRAAGDNPAAARALGVNVSTMVILSLMLSNAMAALSGALLAQELGSAGFDHGLGMIVTGLACVILGGAFFRRSRFSVQLLSTVLGTLVYRLIIAFLLLLGVVSTDLRLFTAAFVLLALLLPGLLSGMNRRAGAKREGGLPC